jgi:BirA family biotin operon repressor/biotin-[acetyl-CoA-carboxylase] ligase
MWVVLGVGVNVSQCPNDFTPEVAEMATSLFAELTHSVSREPLIAALLEELDRMYRDLREGDISAWLAVYRQDCVNLGKTVRLMRSEGSVTALAVDIDDLFGLVVCHPDGSRETIRSGEVSVRGLYGYVE